MDRLVRGGLGRRRGGVGARAAETAEHLGLRATVATVVVVTARGLLLAALGALDDGVGDALRDELDRADRVVVAGDDVVDPRPPSR